MTLTFSLTEQDRKYLAQHRLSYHGVIADIIRAVSVESGVSVADLKGPSRLRRFVVPRQLIYYLAHKQGASLPQIGRALGDRDHTTVLGGIRAHAARMGDVE